MAYTQGTRVYIRWIPQTSVAFRGICLLDSLPPYSIAIHPLDQTQLATVQPLDHPQLAAVHPLDHPQLAAVHPLDHPQLARCSTV
jgi:hypothetical protein